MLQCTDIENKGGAQDTGGLRVVKKNSETMELKIWKTRENQTFRECSDTCKATEAKKASLLDSSWNKKKVGVALAEEEQHKISVEEQTGCTGLKFVDQKSFGFHSQCSCKLLKIFSGGINMKVAQTALDGIKETRQEPVGSSWCKRK